MLSRPPDDRQLTQTGSISQAIENAEKKGLTQVIPDGFPGPTTVLLISAKNEGGTTAKHMTDVIQVLKKIGVRVFVACPSNPPYAFELKKHADKIIFIPHGKFSFTALWTLRRQVRKYKINVVHSHGRTAGIYSRLLGTITSASILHSPHGVSGETGFSGDIKRFIDKVLAGFKYEGVYSSESERLKAIEQGIQKPGQESQVIDNAVDLAKYPARATANIAMNKIDPDKPETFAQIRIGAYLRTDSTRGHSAFLKLVKEAAGQGQYTCAGMSRQQLSKFGSIPSNLEVVGPVSDPKQWLYSLDVFISTSSADGQVVGANEAIAAGAICLLSRIGPHEIFHTHHAALLFDAKSTASYNETLTELKKDRAMRDMLIGNSRYMLERFNDAETFRMKLIDLYRTSVKRAAGLVL